MKNRRTLLTITGLFIAMTACTETEKQTATLSDGSYTGTFTVEYDDGQNDSNSVTITISGNHYSCSAGENHIPAGGHGTFTISGSTITFRDEMMWTADFDWNLILNGEYNFKIDGGEIEISAMKNSLGLYQYKLRKDE